MANRNVRSVVRSCFAATVALTAAVGTVQAELPKGKPFQELQSQIQQTAAMLQVQIDSLLGQVNTLEATAQAHGGQIDELYFQIDLANDQLDALEAALEGKQNTITGSCPAGSAVRAVHADGSVECEQDTGEGIKLVSSETTLVYPYENLTISCPDGYIPMGGGYHGASALNSITASRPSSDGKGWTVGVTYFTAPVPMPFYLYVNCAQK